MKLLLDQNLSYRILSELEMLFPGSSHVRLLGLETADDRSIWQYARENEFVIVTQDSDFHELATLYGAPPKIVWLKSGNQPRQYVKNILLKNSEQLKTFEANPESAVIEIY